MMWMLSPAEFVWMIRSFDSCADSEEKDAVHRTIPARAVKPPRNTCLLVMFVILSTTSYPPEAFVRRSVDLSGDKSVTRRYFTVAPSTNAFNVNHSASLCELNCWAPPWCGSPPACSASGCLSNGLSNRPGAATRWTSSKFRRDCSSFQVALPGESGTRWNGDRKSTRLNSSHQIISYAVFCLKKKKKKTLWTISVYP